MRENTVDGQLNIFCSHTESSLKQYLEECLGRPVSVAFTENSTSMLSVRVRDGVMRVRLHRMFINSDIHVVNEIVSFLKNRRGKMPLFRSFIRDHREHVHKKPPKKVSVKTLGACFDLRELFHEMNETYFGGSINAAITWGSRNARGSVRKRTLGSYNGRSHIIRINPVLDKRTVPRYFIAFVVHHEMLHAALGITLRGKRRSVHSQEFKKREKLFKEYERAIAWERGRA